MHGSKKGSLTKNRQQNEEDLLLEIGFRSFFFEDSSKLCNLKKDFARVRTAVQVKWNYIQTR